MFLGCTRRTSKILNPDNNDHTETATSPQPEISVIVPAFNERDSLQDTVNEILDVCAASGVSTHVIIVDDGSDDGTGEITEVLANNASVSLYKLNTNQGMGAAMRIGVKHALGKWICFLPGDGQFSPREMLSLFEDRSGNNAIAGEVSTSDRAKADSLIRVTLSRVMRLLMRLTHPNMPKFNGVLLVQRQLVENLRLRGTTGFVHMEILDRLRREHPAFSLAYKPISVRPRLHGPSKTANMRGILAIILDMLRLRADYWGLLR